MKITILGCGGSSGVPLIGCECRVCKSSDPKNKRLRSSVFVESENTNILIDCSPDIRQQALANNIKRLDAILLTHSHADHVTGIIEMRSFNYLANKAIPVYSDKPTLDDVTARFGYAFIPEIPKNWYRPYLIPNQINADAEFTIGEIKVRAFPQTHGPITSLGFQIGGFAYSTDTNRLDEKILESLKGIKLWIVDCLGHGKAPTHSHLEQSLEWINIVKPERAVLTHMGHELDYNALKAKLPAGVEPGYDGMMIEI